MKINAKKIVYSQIKLQIILLIVINGVGITSIIGHLVLKDKWNFDGEYIFLCNIYFLYYLIKYIKLLKSNKVNIIENYIDNLVFYSKGNYIISELGIVNLKNFYIVDYKDIRKMFYKYDSFVRGGSLNKYLVVVDKNGKKTKYLIDLLNAKSNNLFDFIDLAYKKNPNIEIEK